MQKLDLLLLLIGAMFLLRRGLHQLGAKQNLWFRTKLKSLCREHKQVY